MVSTIASNQCKIMQEWIKNSTHYNSTGDARVSKKKRLKDEFERLKPKILSKLSESYK